MRVPRRGEQFPTLEAQEYALRLGMWAFLASELLLFSGVFALYAGYRAMYVADFEAAIRHNTLALGTLNTFVLLTSSLTVALAVWAIRVSRPMLAQVLVLATIGLGLVFLAVKTLEYAEHVHEGALPGRFYRLAALPTFGANRFYTLYWASTGLHAAHVTAGLCVLGWLFARARSGAYTPAHHATFEMGTLYWHLVDIIWIFLWPLLYLA